MLNHRDTIKEFASLLLGMSLIGGAFASTVSAAEPLSPGNLSEEKNLSEPANPDRSFSFKKERQPGWRLRLNLGPKPDAGSNRANRGEVEAEQILRNDLTRFGNEDDHGGLAFSFYRDRAELGARSVTGDQDWIGRLDKDK